MRYVINWKVSLAVLFILSSGCVASQSIPFDKSRVAPSPEAQLVEFCELVQNPAVYNGKVIRIQAEVIVGMETAFLYDPRCDSRETRVYFDYGNDESSEEIDELLGVYSMNSSRKANITVVGRYESSNAERYGHLDSFRHHLSITKLISGEKRQTF